MKLAEEIGKLLAEKNMTIAVAESCTGGLVSNLITDVAGASNYFDRGIVSYSNHSKIELLNVREETLRLHGAVSKETAIEMAVGIKKTSGVSIGVGITGIAGPTGGTKEKPVGTVHVALATPSVVENHEFCFDLDRIEFKQLVAETVFDLIKKYLLHN